MQPQTAPPSPTPQPLRAVLRRALAAGAVALAVAACFWLLPPLQVLEERSRDALTPRPAADYTVPGVVVVDISEESLKKMGMWPWSRARMADLIEELLGPLRAKGVALDMVLPEPADAAGDARLASLAQHAPLALAQVLDFVQRGSGIAIGTPAGGTRAPAHPHLMPQATGYVANHAGLRQARCVGHISVRPDADGVVRRVFLHAAVHERAYPTLSVALMECVDAKAAQRALDGLGPHRGEGWRIPFRRDVHSFFTLPAEAVLQGQVDPELVRGKYVVIGSSAVGLSDYVATPVEPVTAGVLVHAQVLSELLNALERPHPGAWLVDPQVLSALGLLAGLAVLAAAFAWRTSAGVALLALLGAAWLALCAAAFGAGSAPAVLPAVGGFVSFAAAWLALDLAEARRTSRRILNTLAHYVAEPVLRLLVRQGLENTLTPARKQITVLVADMAGYTRLTAESGLEHSATLTTEFLEAITQPVLRSGGTLDRYTGDGLIAFWGAPLDRADHAAGAFQAALEMLDALAALNVRRTARREKAIGMRIGIEAGEALVGDLGSSARSVYTAVGTCINLASRLQELARDMEETLIVGPQARVGIAAPLRPLGGVQLRGLPQPIEVFGLPRLTEAPAVEPVTTARTSA
ncbi:CHASE2 domain-containing protein [Ramlibacter sp. PS4R-6]|uniref:CHASE2 domain-containing protein n=1 Tax=Ramlibacter sp. PS4R-6 TaxID=3133438 RepID=UPI0030953374